MMKMKKFSAALLAVVMLVSMLSCMVLGATAASDLGGPVSIVKVAAGGVQTGKDLDNNILIVNSDWSGKTDEAPVFLKLDGTQYKGYYGVNAFSEIGDAVLAAKSNDTIYVAAGVYTADLNLPCITDLKIYGPNAGVNPNVVDPVTGCVTADANPARPGASMTDTTAAAETEAVYLGIVKMVYTANNPDEHLTMDGFYFGENAYFMLNNGGTYRIGTYVRNNVVNVNSADFFSMNRGQNPGFEFENNRVLRATRLQQVGGFMGGIYRGNYFNLSSYMLHPSSVQNGAVGTVALVENNYFENCAGIVTYGSNNYQTVQYSIRLINNTVNNIAPGSFLLYNEYDSRHSLPGIKIEVIGNRILNVPAGTTIFQFPTFESEHNLTRSRYNITISNNEINLPKNQTLIDSAMAGTINATGNTFTNGITIRQINHADDCTVNLFPSYVLDANGNKVALGETKLLKVDGKDVTAEEEESKDIHIDLGQYTEDTLDLENYLVYSEGCSIELYEDVTLQTLVDDNLVYFDGYKTDRYVKVVFDDNTYSVYHLHFTRPYNATEAKLLKVQESNRRVDVAQSGNKFTVTMGDDIINLDYQLKVSSGATYKLYSDSVCTKEVTITDNYIPYSVGGKNYTLYVKVTAEDAAGAVGYYTIEFVRNRSAYFDPSITGIASPSDGTVRLLIDRVDNDKLYMSYDADDKLLDKTLFDFTTTPGATYKVYAAADTAKKTVLSSSSDKKELALKDGVNSFVIEVSDGTYTNVMNFEVLNGTLSDDAVITGLIGQAPVMINNTITMVVGGDSFSGTFTTRNRYAVVDVYADAAHKIKVEPTKTDSVDPITNRNVSTRTFNLATAHNNNIYYVVCTAEDGKTTRNYTMYLEKTVAVLDYTDVADDAWYAKAIQTASDAGYLNGETKGEEKIFRPTDSTSRQEMATIIARLMGINGAAYTNAVKLGYKDEASIGAWALDNVKVCKYYGIMTGSKEADGLYFKPESSITREETMKVFVNYLGVDGNADLSRFKDSASISGWAVEYAEAAVASGLFAGDDKGYLNPKKNINRAEIAVVVTRVLDR